MLLTLQPSRRDADLQSRLLELPCALNTLLSEQSAIVLSAHIGPWELLPTLLSPQLRCRPSVVAVYRPLHNWLLDAWLRRRRAQRGCELVATGGSAARLREVLERGGVVCLLSDQRPSRAKVSNTAHPTA